MKWLLELGNLNNPPSPILTLCADVWLEQVQSQHTFPFAMQHCNAGIQWVSRHVCHFVPMAHISPLSSYFSHKVSLKPPPPFYPVTLGFFSFQSHIQVRSSSIVLFFLCQNYFICFNFLPFPLCCHQWQDLHHYKTNQQSLSAHPELNVAGGGYCIEQSSPRQGRTLYHHRKFCWTVLKTP